jgi:hypothetical protein
MNIKYKIEKLIEEAIQRTAEEQERRKKLAFQVRQQRKEAEYEKNQGDDEMAKLRRDKAKKMIKEKKLFHELDL